MTVLTVVTVVTVGTVVTVVTLVTVVTVVRDKIMSIFFSPFYCDKTQKINLGKKFKNQIVKKI